MRQWTDSCVTTRWRGVANRAFVETLGMTDKEKVEWALNDRLFCYDPKALNAVEEIPEASVNCAMSIYKLLGCSRLNVIMEIGPGLGRLVRSFIEPGLAQKAILVDLPECLEFSKAYLAINGCNMGAFEFIHASELSEWNGPLDLVVNLESWGEMPQDGVDYFMDQIKRLRPSYVYSFNTSDDTDRTLLSETYAGNGPEGCKRILNLDSTYNLIHQKRFSGETNSWDMRRIPCSRDEILMELKDGR